MNARRPSLARALLLAILSAQCCLAAAAAPPAGRSLHGVDLAPFVRVEAWDAHLRLAGARVVDHHYLPFQVIALYVGAGAPDPDMLAAGLVRCRIEIHWLGPAMSEADAATWWDAQFARAVPDPMARRRLQERLQRLATGIGSPPRGAVTSVEYDPDAGLVVQAAGAPPLRFTGLELVRAILGVWLGPAAGRKELIGAAPAAKQ